MTTTHDGDDDDNDKHGVDSNRQCQMRRRERRRGRGREVLSARGLVLCFRPRLESCSYNLLLSIENNQFRVL